MSYSTGSTTSARGFLHESASLHSNVLRRYHGRALEVCKVLATDVVGASRVFGINLAEIDWTA